MDRCIPRASNRAAPRWHRHYNHPIYVLVLAVLLKAEAIRARAKQPFVLIRATTGIKMNRIHLSIRTESSSEQENAQ